MSETRYSDLVTRIRELLNVFHGTCNGSPSRAAFHLVLEQVVPEKDRQQLVDVLNAMMQDPNNVMKYKDFICGVPQKLIGVSPELRDIRKIIGECGHCWKILKKLILIQVSVSFIFSRNLQFKIKKNVHDINIEIQLLCIS